jgi:hypothetical protein
VLRVAATVAEAAADSTAAIKAAWKILTGEADPITIRALYREAMIGADYAARMAENLERRLSELSATHTFAIKGRERA